MLLSDANEKSLATKVRDKAESFPELRIIWNQNAIDYFVEMDLLCITSYNESQPLVLFEAIANKALPFGWKVGDVNDDFAFVVDEEESVEGLVQEIVNLWNNQLLFEAKLNKSFNLTKQNHTWESIFAQYEQRFNTILTDHKIL